MFSPTKIQTCHSLVFLKDNIWVSASGLHLIMGDVLGAAVQSCTAEGASQTCMTAAPQAPHRTKVYHTK